jgi:hypothetical protein
MLPITLSPETTYATKVNILRPGTQAAADAAELVADARIEDVLDTVGADVANLTINPAIGA